MTKEGNLRPNCLISRSQAAAGSLPSAQSFRFMTHPVMGLLFGEGWYMHADIVADRECERCCCLETETDIRPGCACDLTISFWLGILEVVSIRRDPRHVSGLSSCSWREGRNTCTSETLRESEVFEPYKLVQLRPRAEKSGVEIRASNSSKSKKFPLKKWAAM